MGIWYSVLEIILSTSYVHNYAIYNAPKQK